MQTDELIAKQANDPEYYRKIREREQAERDSRTFLQTVRYHKSEEGGRRWLYFGHDNNQRTLCLEFYPEWSKTSGNWSKPRSLFFKLGIRDDWESTITVGLGIPFLFKGFFVLDKRPGNIIKNLVGEYGDTSTGFSIDKEAIHLNLLSDNMGYSKKKGWGRVFFIRDLLKGKSKTTSKVIYSTAQKIVIPASGDYPEKEYLAKIRRKEFVTKYSRWFKKEVWDRWEVEVEGGVPHPGKGTCSWNCDEDSLTSVSFGHGSVNNVQEALQGFIDSVQERRREYPL